METNVEMEKEMKEKKPSIFGIITSPSVQFERMKKNAPVGGPLILMLVLMAVMSVLVSYLALKNPSVQQAYAQAGITPSKSVTLTSGVIGGVIGGVVGFLISAAFFKICMIFMGNDITYKKLLSIVIYSSIISILGLLINGVIALAVGGYDATYTSLAPLFTDNQVLYAFMKSFDLFQIWYLVVLGLGLRIVAGLSKNQAITLVVILFLISAGLSSLSGLFQTAGM